MDSEATKSLSTEFELSPFAEYYEQLSDSFIDIQRAARSLASMLRRGMTVFEIGLGTGYFAQHLSSFGIDVCGIQPPDQMLDRLKLLRPNIKVLGEMKLENYNFDRQYDAIVSHSSIFLFTKHHTQFGGCGEVCSELVFQSFLKTRMEVYSNLLKVLTSLSPAGRLFINVQGNPLPRTEVGPPSDRLIFEMVTCVYDFRLELVEKNFKATYQDKSYVIHDRRYCCTFADLNARLGSLGARCSLSADGDWAIFSKAT
jgi:SAM-dependent methyltransferase